MTHDRDRLEIKVPDDLSGLADVPPGPTDGGGGGNWHVTQRLLLRSGDEFEGPPTPIAHEPHLGDLYGAYGVAGEVMTSLHLAQHNGCVLFLPIEEGVLYVPVDSVQGVFVDVTAPDDDEPKPGSMLKSGHYATHAGDSNADPANRHLSLDDEDTQLWVILERLTLANGMELDRLAHEFRFEPHLENVKAVGNGVALQMNAAREYGVLRFLPTNESMFFTLLSNVRSTALVVVRPDGSEIHGCDLKPGWHSANN